MQASGKLYLADVIVCLVILCPPRNAAPALTGADREREARFHAGLFSISARGRGSHRVLKSLDNPSVDNLRHGALN